MNSPDPVPPQETAARAEAQRVLTDGLRELHGAAGSPSTRQLAAQIASLDGNPQISHVAVHAALSGGNLPRWNTLRWLVRALGGDDAAEERFRALHAACEQPPRRAAAGREAGREFRVASGLDGDRRYQVAELTPDRGLVTVLGGLERWQALAIVALLDPPFKE